MPPDAEVGGPCGLLPLVIHWASLPHRPRLIYEFLNTRFPNELSLEVLRNGTGEQIAAAYRAAAARGTAAMGPATANSVLRGCNLASSECGRLEASVRVDARLIRIRR